MDKRIYSLNLGAYIILKTGLAPELHIDKDNGEGLVHMIFPESAAVDKAIAAYKQDSDLHNFLQAYNELRLAIKGVKDNEN